LFYFFSSAFYQAIVIFCCQFQHRPFSESHELIAGERYAVNVVDQHGVRMVATLLGGSSIEYHSKQVFFKT